MKNCNLLVSGLLPRPDEMKDIPVRGLPEYDPDKKDQWTREKALFGQNDYIGAF